MEFLPRCFYKKCELRDRDSLYTLMYNLEDLLKNFVTDIYIEARDGAKIKAADLHSALMDSRARAVKLSVCADGYRVCVRAVLDPLSIELMGYGNASRELFGAIVKEIEPESWPKRLWGWFRGNVWHGVVAGLIVAALLGVLGWLAGQA